MGRGLRIPTALTSVSPPLARLSQVAHYKDPWHAFETIFRMLVGDWDVDEIANVDENVAYAFFITFTVVGNFMLLNMFLAVIMEAYESLGEAKEVRGLSPGSVLKQDLRYYAVLLFSASPGARMAGLRSIIKGEEGLQASNGFAEGIELCDHARVLRLMHRQMPGHSAYMSSNLRALWTTCCAKIEAKIGIEDEEEPETVRPKELMAPPFNLSHVQARAIIRDCRYTMKHWCEHEEDKGPEQSAPQSDEMRAYVDQRIENLEAKLEETMSMLQKALELKSPNGL